MLSGTVEGTLRPSSRDEAPRWLNVWTYEERHLAVYCYDLGGYHRSRFGPVRKEQLFEEALREQGFLQDPDFWIGDPTREIALEVFSRCQIGVSEYLVFIDLPGDRMPAPEGIYVPSRPALMRLLAELAPVVRLAWDSADRAEWGRAA